MASSVHEPCYTTFLYHNHPATPVTVGWMNFDQQQQQAGMPSSASPAGRRYNNAPSAPGGQLHRLNPAAQQASSVDCDTFYGLPYRVDEPAPQAVASSPSRASIIAIEEDDDDASSVASASSVEGDGDAAAGEGETIQAMNRNARRPKNANHGKRPVSRISRR
jgi:hypothetical protein